MIEKIRPKTHSKNPDVRLFYFVYAVLFFNAWVMTCAYARLSAMSTNNNGNRSTVPMQDIIGLMMLMGLCIDNRYLEPEPPPVPP